MTISTFAAMRRVIARQPLRRVRGVIVTRMNPQECRHIPVTALRATLLSGWTSIAGQTARLPGALYWLRRRGIPAGVSNALALAGRRSSRLQGRRPRPQPLLGSQATRETESHSRG